MHDFHAIVSKELEENGFIRSIESIRSKEKDFEKWGIKLKEWIDQSGASAIEGSYWKIVGFAKDIDDAVCKVICENFKSAIAMTPKGEPEIMDSGKSTTPKGKAAGTISTPLTSGDLLDKFIMMKSVKMMGEIAPNETNANDEDERIFKKKNLQRKWRKKSLH
eukprot:NODE_591_length_5620_cov_0.949828.p4 type:complete len:163 gc:universal NODE_591_length_5620_cov_0.949828:5620-5132(-)